jgi:hypothetical protein
MIKKLVWICGAIFILAGAVFAQGIGSGTLNGTVTDPSGAAIVAARVTTGFYTDIGVHTETGDHGATGNVSS